jgi:quercetin dioxygenase-like cupin family protein
MMKIFASGGRASVRAGSDRFTGTVWQDPVIQAPDPARVQALLVTFEPGARTVWHTHPLGQTLHVTSGAGLVGTRNGQPRLIRAGDTVWFAPDEEHWHGAAPETGMTHLAIQEARDGSAAHWLEHVSDADYLKPVQ